VPHCDNAIVDCGPIGSSCAADVVPMHRMQWVRPSGASEGARAAGDGGPQRKRGGWLWWLLGLLALLLLGALLLGLFNGDDKKASSGKQSAQKTAAPSAGAAAGAGSLTAGGTNLLPVPSGGLADFEGRPATGKDVTVQSVVKDEGFWVGSSKQDRVYVEYGGDVGTNENQGFEPKVGEHVNLTGPVRPAPANPARTLNLPTADARMVSRQGAYINAEDVELR
jgi:hypothetical protein